MATANQIINGSLKWDKAMRFICQNRQHQTALDTNTDHGGLDSAPTPKELLLNAMMGCTAIDVVAMLQKMRQEIKSFEMSVEAHKNLDHPVHFKKATLVYRLHGTITPANAIKSVEMSLTKYCGVNYIISKTCDIHYQLELNGELIKSGTTNFSDPIN